MSRIVDTHPQYFVHQPAITVPTLVKAQDAANGNVEALAFLRTLSQEQLVSALMAAAKEAEVFASTLTAHSNAAMEQMVGQTADAVNQLVEFQQFPRRRFMVNTGSAAYKVVKERVMHSVNNKSVAIRTASMMTAREKLSTAVDRIKGLELTAQKQIYRAYALSEAVAESETKQAIKDQEVEMTMKLQKQIDQLKEQQRDVKRGRYSILELEVKREKLAIADEKHPAVARHGPIITELDDSEEDS